MTAHELDALNRYQTDKLARCPVNRHDYGAAYDFHFGPFRDRPVAFWEIGIDRGDSLRLWADYFPLGRVVGIDLRPPTLPGVGDLPRVGVRLGNATDPAFVAALAAEVPPDIVLDDGSHLATDLRRAFDLIWPHTRSLYAVEDLGTQHRHFHGGAFLDGPPFVDFLTAEAAALTDDLGRPACRRLCFEPGIAFLYR